MKRFLAIGIACVVLMTAFAGCGEKPSYEAVNTDTVDVTATDVFGEHSITVLGDSISHGAASVDIHEKGWVALVKARINELTGDNNYGFTSVEGTLWGQTKSYELHEFPETEEGFKNRGDAGKGWTEYRTAELLGTKGLGSSVKDATLTFTAKEHYKYFYVYYEAGADYGTFEVYDSAGEMLMDVDASKGEGYSRTEPIELPEDNKIILKATSDKEVIFTGIGYYNKPDGVVVSNYANSGLQLAGTGKASDGNMTGLDEKFLDMATKSGTLIFAIGYNDAYFTTDMDVFAEKIDYLIEKVNENGTKLIVSDCVWDKSGGDKLAQLRTPRVSKVKAQLKRLAEETGGVYVEHQAIYGDAILETLGDGVHPNADGHAMMANAILEAMGLAEGEG